MTTRDGKMDPRWRRIVVVGCSGSGKTTFSRELAAAFGHRHIEIDSVFWLPGWTTRPSEEFREELVRWIAGDGWVADGNYGDVRDIIWKRGTAIVWLNYPFRVVFWRVLTRTIRRILRKEELFSGNYETFRRSFLSRDSILLWVMGTYRPMRKRYRQIFEGEEYLNLTRVELRHPRDAERFLAVAGTEEGERAR